MKTEIIRIDKDNFKIEDIRPAAEVIRSGGLVAFPTETVYGLGANALDEKAARGIYAAKGRPPDNPLIVHVTTRSAAEELLPGANVIARKLMDHFWPGPLTIIAEKSPAVPYVITAGLETVAVRMPSHPVALALIREAGVPIAAPSANTSGKPSPTLARHVIDDLYGKVDVIIDAGGVSVGLESTIVDVTSVPPVVLRPGGITVEQLREVLGDIRVQSGLKEVEEKEIPKAPGMKYTHYSPNARVVIIEGAVEKVAARIRAEAGKFAGDGLKVGILATDQTCPCYREYTCISMGSREDPGQIAVNLFSSLRRFDELGVDIILAEAIDTAGMGLAVMNRMVKAAGNEIIKAL